MRTKTTGLLALTLGGCITVTPPIIADRQTVLEQQASGSFQDLQADLDRAGVSPRPVPLTRGQVEGQGAEAERLALRPEEDESDDDLIDRLLARRCVGEARDGTLVETRARCTVPTDPQQVASLVERANRNRWQLWRFLQQQRPGASLDAVRAEWRRVHLEAVVCRGQIQQDDGNWAVKECDRR